MRGSARSCTTAEPSHALLIRNKGLAASRSLIKRALPTLAGSNPPFGVKVQEQSPQPSPTSQSRSAGWRIVDRRMRDEYARHGNPPRAPYWRGKPCHRVKWRSDEHGKARGVEFATRHECRDCASAVDAPATSGCGPTSLYQHP